MYVCLCVCEVKWFNLNKFILRKMTGEKERYIIKTWATPGEEKNVKTGTTQLEIWTGLQGVE